MSLNAPSSSAYRYSGAANSSKGKGKRKADSLSSCTVTVPAKRARKTKDADGVEEKRAARFKSKCPQNILERVGRVMSQRFFMIDRTRDEGALHEEFKVLGSTGNVYTVTIGHMPSCDCPDATKGNHCKHILFIFLKVLGLPLSSTHYYQKALLTNELADIFGAAPQAPTAAASLQVRAAYEKATGSPIKEVAQPKDNVRRVPKEEDDCPICYETMGGAGISLKDLTFCDECGNALHNECFQQWARTRNPLTCVWCRATWQVARKASGGLVAGAVDSEGYINLGNAAGITTGRDGGETGAIHDCYLDGTELR